LPDYADIVPIVSDYFGLLEITAAVFYTFFVHFKNFNYILGVQHHLIVLYCGSVAVCSFMCQKNTFGGMLLHYIYIWLHLAGILTYIKPSRSIHPKCRIQQSDVWIRPNFEGSQHCTSWQYQSATVAVQNAGIFAMSICTGWLKTGNFYATKCQISI